MLPKNYRLPIKTIKRGAGRSVLQTRELTIKIYPNAKEYSRFGVIISKSVVKTAVGRNQIRRRLYQASRAVFSKWPKADYLIIVKQKPADGFTFPKNIS